MQSWIELLLFAGKLLATQFDLDFLKIITRKY